MISYEALFEPIVKPVGVDDPRPVQPTTHWALVTQLRALSMLAEALADCVERSPWADDLLDGWRVELGKQLDKAGDALAVFRETRDCEGQS